MNGQLEMIPGTNRDTSKSQYFTPPKLAQRVVDWAGVETHVNWEPKRTPRVLEPSAGNGALVRPLVAAGAEVYAFEVDERYKNELSKLTGNSFCPLDFLSLEPRDRVWMACDLCVGNFPYHDNLAAEFTLHALKFAPRVVAIYQADIWYTVARLGELWTACRPTRIANLARRPWPGETDYVVAEVVKRGTCFGPDRPEPCTVEWWPEAWR